MGNASQNVISVLIPEGLVIFNKIMEQKQILDQENSKKKGRKLNEQRAHLERYT